MQYFQRSNEEFIAECVTNENKDMFADALLGEVREIESNVIMDCVEAVRALTAKGFDVVRRGRFAC
jgi:hypothetical protein